MPRIAFEYILLTEEFKILTWLNFLLFTDKCHIVSKFLIKTTLPSVWWYGNPNTSIASS